MRLESTMKIADRLNADKYLNTSGPYPTALAQKMYAYAMPRQYTMLKDAPYVIIPVFKSGMLNSGHVSKQDSLSTIWCVIENILLAATAEKLSCSIRTPLNEEHDIVKTKLKVPPTYMLPAFIGIGYADQDEMELEQHTLTLKHRCILADGPDFLIQPYALQDFSCNESTEIIIVSTISSYKAQSPVFDIHSFIWEDDLCRNLL